MLARLGFVTLFALTLAVSGCGRRGPLEPPPGSPPQPPKAAAAAKTVSPDSAAPAGIFRSTGNKSEDAGAVPQSEQKKTRNPSSFVLDPLL